MLLGRQIKAFRDTSKLAGNLAQDLLAAADRVMEHPDTPQAAVVDVRIHRGPGHQIDDRNALAPLAVAVDAADALLDTHRIPGQVVVDQQVAELEVEPLAADLRRQQDVQCIRILLRQREALAKVGPRLVGYAAVHEPAAQSGAPHMSFDIGQRVPEGAEDQGLVVGHTSLVPQDPDEGFHLRVMGIEIVGPLKERFDIVSYLGKKGGIGLAVVRFHPLEAVELAGEDVMQQGRQPIDTARCLAADRGHHELDVPLSVGARQNARHDVEQVVMQPSLAGCEIDGQRFRFPGRERSDVPAAGPVDHGAEGIQLFQGADEADAARVVDPILSQSIAKAPKLRRFSQKEAAPFGLPGPVQAGARFLLPAIPGGAAVAHRLVDEPVGRGHLFEARAVDYQIRPENVEQGKEVFAAQLHRRGGKKHGSLRIVAEVAHGLVKIRLRVPDMVCFVDDDEIEPRRRVEGEQPLAPPPALLLLPEDQIRIEQGERDDGLGVLARPFAFQIRLLQTMAQRRTVQLREVLVEALHLQEPLALGDQGLRADHEHRGDVHARPQFLDDQPGFDRLADPHLVRDQQTGAIRPDQSQHGTILVGNEVYAPRAQRIEAGRRGREKMQAGQAGAQAVCAQTLRLHSLFRIP